MAREILFKAKRIDNGEWVEGYYFCMVHNDGRHIHHFILPLGSDLSLGTPIEKIQVEIKIETLCQYTGLTDKNGNKIWENDVVQIDAYSYTECEGDVCGQIVYSDAYASFGLLLEDRFVTIYDLQGSYTTIYEVLGNVFDNPELLGGGE